MRKDGGAANDLVDAVHATAIFRERNPTDPFWREAAFRIARVGIRICGIYSCAIESIQNQYARFNNYWRRVRDRSCGRTPAGGAQ
jgi:hypothetical protein